MQITGVIPQLRTTDHFETDDAAAVATGLKTNGVPLVRELHETPWETREFTVKDDQGHTLYFGERR